MSDTSGSLTENLIDLIQAAGGTRPDSKGLSELYQSLAVALSAFSPGGSGRFGGVSLSTPGLQPPSSMFPLASGTKESVVTIPIKVSPGGNFFAFILRPLPNDGGPDITIDYAEIDIVNQDYSQLLSLGTSSNIVVPAGSLTQYDFHTADFGINNQIGSDLSIVDNGGLLQVASAAGGVYSAMVYVELI
jgi:hypothetical protein